MITSKLETFEHMFDVIVDEVKKYSPNVDKFTAKAGESIESFDGQYHLR